MVSGIKLIVDPVCASCMLSASGQSRVFNEPSLVVVMVIRFFFLANLGLNRLLRVIT